MRHQPPIQARRIVLFLALCGTPVFAWLFLNPTLLVAQAGAAQAVEESAGIEANWSRYYDRTGERAPRKLLLEALDLFEAEGQQPRRAVDAGCGVGVEGRFLAGLGIEVLAFDAEEEGIQRLREASTEVQAALIRTEVAAFHQADWGQEIDLVFAGHALPFADPGEFAIAWRKMRSSLAPGGRFVGHLFGDRDDWAGSPDMTHHHRQQVEELLADGFVVEVLREVEMDRPGAGGRKHWHVFEIIARKP